jgi:tellurite resistance protein TerA
MAINMRKGDAPISFKKTEVIELKCSWPAATDYDLYALVVYTDGTCEHIATFPAGSRKGIINPSYEYPVKMTSRDGAVMHLGDARRGAGYATETITVRLNPSIRAVIPVAYSAQSNGTGSFRQYQVTTEIIAGDEKVTVLAENANADRTIYTLVPGMITNDGDKFEVHALELYSRRGSENRPGVAVTSVGVTPVMDQGPKNVYK